jgi:hypothetical protein
MEYPHTMKKYTIINKCKKWDLHKNKTNYKYIHNPVFICNYQISLISASTHYQQKSLNLKQDPGIYDGYKIEESGNTRTVTFLMRRGERKQRGINYELNSDYETDKDLVFVHYSQTMTDTDFVNMMGNNLTIKSKTFALYIHRLKDHYQILLPLRTRTNS